MSCYCWRVIRQNSGLKPFIPHAVYNYVSLARSIFCPRAVKTSVFLVSVPGGLTVMTFFFLIRNVPFVASAMLKLKLRGVVRDKGYASKLTCEWMRLLIRLVGTRCVVLRGYVYLFWIWKRCWWCRSLRRANALLLDHRCNCGSSINNLNDL